MRRKFKYSNFSQVGNVIKTYILMPDSKYANYDVYLWSFSMSIMTYTYDILVCQLWRILVLSRVFNFKFNYVVWA